ncbi:MAG: hypothetical protein AB7V18_19500 [Pyrinomonadaceae bacterium]
MSTDKPSGSWNRRAANSSGSETGGARPTKPPLDRWTSLLHPNLDPREMLIVSAAIRSPQLQEAISSLPPAIQLCSEAKETLDILLTTRHTPWSWLVMRWVFWCWVREVSEVRGMRALRSLEHDRRRELLARSLSWAADQIESGHRQEWVLRTLRETFGLLGLEETDGR